MVHRHPSKYIFQKASDLIVFMWHKEYAVPNLHMRRVLYIFSGLEVTSESENRIMLF